MWRLYIVGWFGDIWMMNWKGLWRKRSWPKGGTISEFGCEDSGKPQKTSVKIVGAPDEIRNVHLSNTSLGRYWYARQFGGSGHALCSGRMLASALSISGIPRKPSVRIFGLLSPFFLFCFFLSILSAPNSRIGITPPYVHKKTRRERRDEAWTTQAPPLTSWCANSFSYSVLDGSDDGVLH
jgi:hypothetical protein